MIKFNGNKTKMEFGTGDIGITCYRYDDGSQGGLVFYNHKEPKEIGKLYSNIEYMKGTPDDFPVNMLFTKIESIDAVITALENVKKEMINLQTISSEE